MSGPPLRSVSGQIVPLGDVAKLGEAVRHGVAEPALEIAANLGVRILTERERRGRVLEEKMRDADLATRDLRPSADDLLGDEVESAAPRRELDRALVPAHSGPV